MSRLPSTLSWILRYYLPEIAKIFRIEPMPRNRVQHQKGLSDDAFEQLYPNEEACRKAWFAWRWPEGFKCPRCAGSKYCEIRGRQLLQCRRCRYQTSPIAGTVLQGRACNPVGFITPPMQLLRCRLRGGSRDSDDGRRPRVYRSAPLSARRGRAAPSPCSSASAASCSCVWR